MGQTPSDAEVRSYLFDRKNWGRWGDDDQKGAINLITPAKRLEAFASARTGETLTLARPLDTIAAANNAEPAQHFMRFWYDGGEGPEAGQKHLPSDCGGWAADYYGVSFHGFTTTHLDALCHVWDSDGLYNGRDPHEHVTTDGATFGGVEHWSQDLVTRGVLLDIPRLRGVEHVTLDTPVHGWELEQAAVSQGVTLRSGDALLVHMGRESWQRANPSTPYGSEARPGMDASCLPYLRDNDISILGWDMMDAQPWTYDVPWTVHGAIWSYGIALVDNMLLEQLAQACVARGSSDFALTIAPLIVEGGTGSPVNPLAIL